MRISDLLNQIRETWLTRVSHSLARGEGVRVSFRDQLNRFYDLVEQSVETGDPGWIDPLMDDWSQSFTQSDLQEDEISLPPIMSQIINLSYEVAHEILEPAQAVEVVGALLPVFTHAYEYTTQKEMDVRLQHLSKELGEAQAELERLDRIKSDFIAIAAHELKTPLTLIEGYAAMLRELFPSDDHESPATLLLKGISNGTSRLGEIVDDMIDVSLLDNDLLTLNFQPVWLNRLFDLLCNEFNESVKARQQTLEINDFPGIDEMTFGDPERLYQAFRNVLSNAIKYTPDKGSISVDGRELSGFIEVVITDNGIGIDPAEHARIFEKFGRLGEIELHSSGKTKFKGGGPGLGLQITKGILEAHGGAIWVESEGYDEENCPGSKFHILIPMRSEPPDQDIANLFKPLSEEPIKNDG